MVIRFPKSDNVKENDLIAITKNDKFVGYGTVLTVLTEEVLLGVDKRVEKVFNNLDGELIPYEMTMEG